jgi:hypothetical protein
MQVIVRKYIVFNLDANEVWKNPPWVDTTNGFRCKNDVSARKSKKKLIPWTWTIVAERISFRTEKAKG